MSKEKNEEIVQLSTRTLEGCVEKCDSKYKVSKYNYIFDSDDNAHLIFNTMSGGFATVGDEDLPYLKQILDDPDGFVCDTEKNSKLFQSMIYGGYIVKDDVNELDVLKTRSSLGRFNTEHFHLTIMPTMACNFKCTYCYEEPKPGIMTKETQSALIKWVDDKTEACRIFTVGWFGGEPLLALDCIKNLSSHFKAICDKRNVKYQAGLTTNGYLMNAKVVEQFHDLNITGVHVTIDGPREIHDKRRPLCSGKGTFDVLVKNIEHLIKTQPTVVVKIRVNCDRSNIDHVGMLFEILPTSIMNNAEIYFATVFSCNNFIGHEGDESKLKRKSSTLSEFNELRQKILGLRHLYISSSVMSCLQCRII
ncbi:MAG: radical SAM protein [Methanosarcinaceae archaeon]